MPVNLIDRWNLARTHLEKVFERERVKGVVREKANSLSTRLFRDLITNSPDGEKWEDPSNVFQRRQRFLAQSSSRPSLRKFGITLKQGWVKPKLDFKGSTSKIVRSSINFINLAPHTEWVIEGVDKTYQIPGSVLEYRLYYFWNKQGRIVAPKEITHKGFAPNPFVDKVMSNAETLIDDFERQVAEGLIVDG